VHLSGKRVVVTGGAGFIGSHVVDHLVDTGVDVVAIDDLSVGTRENLDGALERGAKLVVGDVRDADLMRSELAGSALVIHMACDNLRASLEDPMKTHEVNSTGTLVTSLAAVDASVDRFVYVSSSEAYGSAVTIPMSESHPLLPTTVYGASKAAGELYAQSVMRTYGLPVTVVRPFNSYGPREHAIGSSAEVIPRFASRIRAGLPPVIFGDGTQTRDFTWVEETAVGIVSAASSDNLVGEAINIAYGQGVSIREICDLLLDVLDAKELVPDYAEPRRGDVAHHYADTSKARDLLGFRALVPVQEGLERYVRWLDDRTREKDEAGRAPSAPSA
jgi:UDP-glucose 4-epimerase